MLAGLPEVTAHFGRFRVREISLSASGVGQFDHEPMLQAADLLADANCHAVCWNGTSAGWLGFERDRELCQAIERRTKIPACSSVLALAEVFRNTKVARFGLVTPYTDDIQRAIRGNFGAEGFECIAEAHLGISVNFDFSLIEPERISAMVREVAKSKPQAITVFCTNMDGASLADGLERETGIPIYDTIATAVWGSLRVAGLDPARVKGWGRLFREAG
jgi:maleate isomerase